MRFSVSYEEGQERVGVFRQILTDLVGSIGFESFHFFSAFLFLLQFRCFFLFMSSDS